MTIEFRYYLYPLDHPRLAGRGLDASGWADLALSRPGIGDALKQWWSRFANSRFDTGVTADGKVKPGLFTLGTAEHPPVADALRAAQAFVEGLTAQNRQRLSHPLDSKVWRAWMNPELYLNRYGLRLEELDTPDIERALKLVEASLSPPGYQRVRTLMRVNEFLGDLVALPQVLNEHSYNINIFGDLGTSGAWGWNFYGHHICLNCLFIGDQQVLTPVFFGAEPTEIDAGPDAGTVLFADQEKLALKLIQSLPDELARQAILFQTKRDPAMPPGRCVPADELHLAGAFQDNRVIPYEGLSGSLMTPSQQQQLIELVEVFLDYQPEGPKRARLAEVRRHVEHTWFCWIGGTKFGDAFYYRIQSPVILVEFDHHAGVFLSNTEPKRFHVHTLVRTPNGNDYGVDLIRQATGAQQRLDNPE